MEKQKKHSIIITICTIIVIVVIVRANYGTELADKMSENANEKAGEEDTQEVIDIEEQIALDESPFFYPEQEYDYSFMDKTAEELYEEYFTVTEQETEDVHFYIKDGTLYLDEYAETGEYNGRSYFYLEPVKVADNIKMVWYGHPGFPKQTQEFLAGYSRTYFLTTENELFVSGENVGNEVRSYMYYGELGRLDEPYEVNCTSILHRVTAAN